MVRKKIPDAWEDDWETLADSATGVEDAPEDQTPATKAERLAKHEELNKRLWEAA